MTKMQKKKSSEASLSAMNFTASSVSSMGIHHHTLGTRLRKGGPDFFRRAQKAAGRMSTSPVCTEMGAVAERKTVAVIKADLQVFLASTE